MQEKQTIVIVDDHTILREGLKALLNASGGLRVVGEAGSACGAMQCIQAKMPDIALVDINLPKREGLSVIRETTRKIPEVKILVLTMYPEPSYAQLAFKHGARGYCLKTANHKELLFAIRTVLSGKIYMSPEIPGRILEGVLDDNGRVKIRSPWDALTQRELEILKLFGKKHRSKDVADVLGISFKTVQKHRSSIMQKMDLHTASALQTYAIKANLHVH